ncbi:hypothetical protein F511_23766 [Dorcoceras hygrometricum]|uniref:Uncharacterized protein n=1 Tax=Dorcoceras hygrometricum TaxID=472368 RepID=A0A2Z7DGN5_9LAMI|nr:hypothetical protein F511_23766 [Dorcoceras hygrometricum]
MEDGKAELATQKYRVVSANQTYHGEISVGISVTAQGKADDIQEQGGWKESIF